MSPRFALFTIAFFVFATGAKAQTYAFEGVDITPAVSYLQKFVKPLQRELTIYTWSRQGPMVDHGDTQIAQRGAATFWNAYGAPVGIDQMYGFGLYGAADPAVTRNYGGKNGDWLLTEIKLPVGFVLAETSIAVMPARTPADVIAIADHFHCTKSLPTESFFRDGGAGLTKECRSLAVHIYRDILEIDGFFYVYGSSPFKVCEGSNIFGKAFVITSARWMNSDNVHYFTKMTQDRLESRRLIQTLMLKSKESALNEIAPETIPVTKSPLITTQESKLWFNFDLLWKDLEGQPKTANTDQWLRRNMPGCVGSVYDK